MVLAIDFDGTLVEHEFPKIGKEKLFAFDTLKKLQEQEHTLILWTYRSGKDLEEAVEYCKSRGVEFFAVNKNFPEEIFDENTVSRKIYADVYIDDRNVGGFLGWSKIWKILNQNSDETIQMKTREEKLSGNTFSEKLKNIFK